MIRKAEYRGFSSAASSQQKSLLGCTRSWSAGQNKKITIKDEKTGEEETFPVIKESEKNLKLLGDAWRMAQEIDQAIPVLERAAKLSKDGDLYVLLGNLYLYEDRMEDAIRAIENALKKSKS